MLLEMSGTTNPKFLWWQRLIGGSQGQSLYHTESFCALGQPPEVAWTLENLVTYGPGEVLRLWAQREVFLRYCEPEGGG